MAGYVEIKSKKIGEGRPKVCVPLVGRTKQEILSAVDDVVKLAKETDIDMVEFRADFYEELYELPALKELIQEIYKKLDNIILLFTIRSVMEGGEKLKFRTPDINEINRFVIENKLSDMVDVELFSGEKNVRELVRLANENGVKIIMSNHDFKDTPSEEIILQRLRAMQDMGAHIVKIAVMPNTKLQILSLLKAVTLMNDLYARVPVVAISMGSLGAISRVTGEIFGSAITFAALEQGSAPGQIPVQNMDEILKNIGRYCV